MNVTHITLLISICVFNTNCDIHISDHDYEMLPPIFHIDPYSTCLQEGKRFCKMTISLMAADVQNQSRVWELIELTKRSKNYYNHAELYHAICVNNHVEGFRQDGSDLGDLLSQFYTKKYKDIGLKAEVTQIDCNNYDNVHTIGTADILFLIAAGLYFVVIISATVYDFTTPLSREANKYIRSFSILNNLTKLKDDSQKDNFKHLKCIQGIRFYITVLVTLAHTYISFVVGYVASTKYLEEIPQNMIKYLARNFIVFLVHTFFLISAWLLSYNTFRRLQRFEKVSLLRYTSLTFLNRYLRFLPTVSFMVCLWSTVWVHKLFYGPIKDIYSDREYLKCKNNWWMNLIFINNFYTNEACIINMWYLAADTQLYAISLIILIVMWRFQHKIMSIMSSLILIGIAIPVVISYSYNLDTIYKMSPKNLKNKYYESVESKFIEMYSGTYNCMATYMIGLAFGYLYFKLEGGKPIFISKVLRKAAWWCAFIGLPLAAITLPCFEYDRATTALLSGILEPMFALGVGIGILGMSQQIGGFVRRLCEWKPVTILATFTYSVYIIQHGIMFYKTALASDTMQVSDFILFVSFLKDVTLSFCCGFLMHLLVEMPASQLQNILVQKIRNSTNKKVM